MTVNGGRPPLDHVRADDPRRHWLCRPHTWVLPVAVAVLVLLARPAAAHGPQGTMTLLRAEQTAPDRAEIEVGLVYANDADVAEDATVAVTLIAPDGRTVGPMPVLHVRGARYLAAVEVPVAGSWSFTVSSMTPVASVTGTVDITPIATTTSADALVGRATPDLAVTRVG
jgi:hypothetical protein